MSGSSGRGGTGATGGANGTGGTTGTAGTTGTGGRDAGDASGGTAGDAAGGTAGADASPDASGGTAGADSGGDATGGTSGADASTDSGTDAPADTGTDAAADTGSDGGDAAASPIVINEVESNPDPDYVELYNRGSAPVDISGWIIRDNNNGNTFTIPASTTLNAGAYIAFDNLGFGLGGSDQARLFNGTTLIDSYAWTGHAPDVDGGSIGFSRCPNGTGDFAERPLTKGAANNCP
jgi:hypothetical protein